MIVMEGLLLVPPERGAILGRALWKPRYVVLGSGASQKTQNDLMGETRTGPSRKLKSSSKVDVAQQQGDNGLYISIYKAKGDWEFVAQHPISAFRSCEIKSVAHRKQSPSVPTLMLEYRPDTDHEKQRKRRSSRSGGLSSKDPWAGTLLFRTIPEERFTIYDWQVTLKPQLMADSHESFESMDELQSPMSPISPTYSSFTNPFSPRDARTPSSMSRPEYQQRTPSNQTVSTYPHAPRERPSAMISPSPSLRSRRSDLSSQGSSLQPPMGFTSNHPKTYNTGLPSDLPSPASAYDTQFIEGWTSAQGRSSALSSHTRGSNSIASAVAAASPPIGSTPPGPRETILDRAFQMKCIPGSERLQDKDEEKISSIARFEALMREADERKRQKSISSSPRGGWDLDEESEESSNDELEEEGEDDDADGLDMSDHDVVIPTPAQRALDYISGRRTPLPTSRPLSPQASTNPPIPFLNPQAMSAFHRNSSSSAGGLRPRTGTGSSKRNSRPSSMALPSRSVSTTAVPTSKDDISTHNNGNLKTGDMDVRNVKRSSSTSVKRLSFTEFAKRLSSTSSLLLVQTNASSSSGRDGSRRTSSEYGDEERIARRSSVSVRGNAASAAERDARDKRCGWRGSVGVFGSEGGFL